VTVTWENEGDEEKRDVKDQAFVNAGIWIAMVDSTMKHKRMKKARTFMINKRKRRRERTGKIIQIPTSLRVVTHVTSLTLIKPRFSW
jgi:hypothetical protein